jgi:hypothetical protein
MVAGRTVHFSAFLWRRCRPPRGLRHEAPAGLQTTTLRADAAAVSTPRCCLLSSPQPTWGGTMPASLRGFPDAREVSAEENRKVEITGFFASSWV